MAPALLAPVLLLSTVFSSLTIASPPKVVSLPFYRNAPRTVNVDKFEKRAHTQSVDLGNAVQTGLYYVNASVGTPPQTVQLQIDTGSSDVWMFGPKSCDTQTSKCLGGFFDPSQSSSLSVLAAGAFSIHYVTPGSGVTGDYVSDNFAIGSINLKGLTMAIATLAKSVPTGIMGIGFDSGESSAPTVQYHNIIDQMVLQNVINTRAYSLWLDDLTSSTGTALFGGYDTAKFSGSLVGLQIQPDAQTGNITSMTVAWTGLAVNDPNNGSISLTDSTFVAPAILDSGTTFTALPTSLFNQLATFVGAVNDPTFGPIVNCNISSYTGTLDFTFGGAGGPTISVPFSEFAVPTLDNAGNPLTFPDGSEACLFGMFPVADGEQILFGDTFMRSAYVVYDLDNLVISIAPTVFNTTKSNIVEITNSTTGGSGGGSGVSSVLSAVTAKQTATGLAAPGVVQATTVTQKVVGTSAPKPSFGILGGGGTAKGTSAGAATGTGTAAPTATKTGAAGARIGGEIAWGGSGPVWLVGVWVAMVFGGGFVVWG